MTHGKYVGATLSLTAVILTGCGTTGIVGAVGTPLSASLGQPFSHVKSLVFMRGLPAAPVYQAKSVKKAAATLEHLWASSRPYSGTVPKSPPVITHAYWGPSVLTVTTTQQKTIEIFPTSWIVKKGHGEVMHYVPNVLTIKMNHQVSYVTNPALYHWFAHGGWESEF